MDIKDVTRVLQAALQTQVDHDREHDAYEGYSWGYHGAALIAERDSAMTRLGEALDRYIDDRVQSALAERA